MKNELSFEDHINNFCKKAGQILNALARVAPYMCLEKKENNYESVRHISVLVFPLVRMFHGRGLINKINSLDERALKI